MKNNDDLETLINRVRSGDDDAFAELCKKYETLVSSCAKKHAQMGSEYGSVRDMTDDFRQEASLALLRAANTFRLDQSKVTFGLYAKRCIENALVSQLRKLSAKGRRSKKSRSPDSAENGGNGDGSEIEAAVISEDEKRRFTEKVGAILTPLEASSLLMSMEGLRPRKIAVELGTTPRVVSNALFRARSKIRKRPDILI